MKKTSSCSRMLKSCKVRDTIKNVTEYVEKNELSPDDVTEIIKHLTKNGKKSHFDTDIEKVSEIFCDMIYKYTLTSSDVDMIIEKIIEKTLDSNIGKKYCGVNKLTDAFNPIINAFDHKNYIFNEQQIYKLMHNSFGNDYVLDSFIKLAKGTKEDIDMICNHIAICMNILGDKHSLTKIMIDKHTQKCHSSISKIILANNITLTEEYMTHILLKTLHINLRYSNTCLESSNNDDDVKKLYCNEHVMIPLDMFKKFQKDYHNTNGNKYIMTHKMFYLLMLLVDITKLSNEIIDYLNLTDSINFFVCAFYKRFSKNNILFKDTVHTYSYDTMCDVAHRAPNIINYEITNEVTNNILYVAELSILNKIPNYKNIFRLFFRFSCVDNNICNDDGWTFEHDNIHVPTVDLPTFDFSKESNTNRISEVRNTIMNHMTNNKQYCDDIIRAYYLKIMSISINELDFDEEDMIYACMLCDSVAINILLKKVNITDRAITYLCTNPDTCTVAKTMMNLFDNKIIPKFEHVKYIMHGSNYVIIDFFVRNGLGVTKELMEHCACHDVHMSNMSEHLNNYKHIQNELYLLLKYSKDRKIIASNKYTLYSRRIHDNGLKIKNSCKECKMLKNNSSIMHKNDLVAYCLYNNTSVTIHDYLYALNEGLYDVIEYCEKDCNMLPNEHVLMFINNPLTRRECIRKMMK